MPKFYPIKVWHLGSEDFCTPNGNRPHITTDGWFGGEVVYEPKTKKVYRVGLQEVSNVDPKFIEKCEEEVRWEEFERQIKRDKISIEKLEKALEVLNG